MCISAGERLPEETVVSVPRCCRSDRRQTGRLIATAQPGVLLQREVSAGADEGGSVPIHADLVAAEAFVTRSFLLRAASG
jgi:hypothetical protein